MRTLFSVEPNFPKGFLYKPSFLTEAEETDLLQAISTIELHPFSFQGFTANRKVASFGYDYSFDSRSLAKGKTIPTFFNSLLAKVGMYTSIPASAFAELLVTEYPPGSVINWHRDAPPFDVIAGISLGADCNFRLRPQDKVKQIRKNLLTFQVQAKSLYVMQGEARSDWQHSIEPVSKTRYSITLRTLST